MYAVIESGNKQYKIQKGDVIDIELQKVQKDQNFLFDKVLLVADNGNVSIGMPYLDKSKVSAKVLDEVKDKKIFSFKYKNKTGYHRTIGHRQKYTRVLIEEISHGA